MFRELFYQLDIQGSSFIIKYSQNLDIHTIEDMNHKQCI